MVIGRPYAKTRRMISFTERTRLSCCPFIIRPRARRRELNLRQAFTHGCMTQVYDTGMGGGRCRDDCRMPRQTGVSRECQRPSVASCRAGMRIHPTRLTPGQWSPARNEESPAPSLDHLGGNSLTTSRSRWAMSITVPVGSVPAAPNLCRDSASRSTSGQRAALSQMERNLACGSPLAVSTSRWRARVNAT